MLRLQRTRDTLVVTTERTLGTRAVVAVAAGLATLGAWQTAASWLRGHEQALWGPLTLALALCLAWLAWGDVERVTFAAGRIVQERSGLCGTARRCIWPLSELDDVEIEAHPDSGHYRRVVLHFASGKSCPLTEGYLSVARGLWTSPGAGLEECVQALQHWIRQHQVD